MPRYHTVLLDADNTLFDFNATEEVALHNVLLSRGYTPDEETVAIYSEINAALWEAFSRGEVEQDFLLEERFRRFMNAVGGDHDPARFNLDYQRQLGANPILIPGAVEFCRNLNEMGCSLAIVTNGATVAQKGRYHNSPIKELVPQSCLFISQEIGVGKPDPLFFDYVCRNLGISDRSDAIVVGDSLSSDVLGGNRAGIETIWFNPKDIPLAGLARPTYTVTDYAQAEQIIRGAD